MGAGDRGALARPAWPRIRPRRIFIASEAIDRLGRTGLGVEVARARLLYGEWLRRHRRRGEARDQLRAGYEIFVSGGAGAFAERARTELRATGERAPERTAQTRNALTAREAHIARLAGHGASNPEIAAQVYISPATVAYHLRKVFTTLGITSRSQFAKALPQNQTEPAGQVAGTEGLSGGGARRRRLSRRLSGRWRRLSGYADAIQRPRT